MKRLVVDETFECARAERTVRFVVIEASLRGDLPELPFNFAQAPRCNGWPCCGVFPREFPAVVSEVPIGSSGCHYFDRVMTATQPRAPEVRVQAPA